MRWYKQTLLLVLMLGMIAPVGLWGQRFRIQFSEDNPLPQDFWTADSLLLTGTVEALSGEDSLISLYYRQGAAGNWVPWQLEGDQPGIKSFRLLLRDLPEGYQVLEISAVSRLHPAPDTVLAHLAWVTDRTPPTLVGPAQLFQELTDSLTLAWAVRLQFNEALAILDPSRVSIRQGETVVLSGDSTFSATRFQGALWQARLSPLAGRLLDSLLTQGAGNLRLVTGAGWARDLAGNTAPSAQAVLQPKVTGIIQQFQWLTPAISPNGDGVQDTLLARCTVSQPTLLHWALYTPGGRLVDREFLQVSPNDGILSRSRRHILQETSEGDIQIQWHPSLPGDSVRDGRYTSVLYAQQDGQGSGSDFQITQLIVDRTAPEIGWLSPPPGDGTLPIRPQESFALAPAADSLDTPIRSVRLRLDRVKDSTGTVLDSLWLAMEADTLSGRYMLDLASRQLSLEIGSHQLALTLTDLAGNQAVKLLNYRVSNPKFATVGDIRPFNYPNPFNPRNGESTTITFLQQENSPATLEIFDFAGQLVWRTEIAPVTGSGLRRSVRWSGRDLQGRLVGTGVYLARIRFANQDSPLWRIVVKNF